jgi:LCP family protein required for cell wall assembly
VVRLGIAGLLGLVVPGSGHLFAGRRRDALVFLLPTAAMVGWLVGIALAVGPTGILALLVAPGVLPVLALVNVAIALWRVVAALDGARSEVRTRRSVALFAAGLAVLVLVPHLVAGRLIASTSDFLDSTFAGPAVASPTPTPEPGAEATAGPPRSVWVYPPRLPDNGLDDAGIVLPTPEPTPAPPPGPYGGGGGAAALPDLGAAVPWDAPGAIPWGDDGRFDLLLLGSDAGSDRWSRRMDVMLLVEVDVATGNIAMIGLPRNLQNAPYPPGFARDAVACGCLTGLLNELYVEATVRHPDRWPGSGAVKGIGAVRSVVSELTGRPIDAVLVADLMGVIDVVDAMGGVDIKIPSAVRDDRYPDPIMGRIELYIPAGQQHLDGRLALAYARSRHSSSDYARMARQQTLLLAIRAQIGFATIFSAPDLFAAAKGRTWTDLPRDSLPALVELFGKAANGSVKQLRIVPPTYKAWLTAAGIARIRADIADLLGVVPPATPTPAPTEGPAPTSTPGPTEGATPTPDPSILATPTPEPSPSPAPPSPTPDPTASPP